MSKTVVRALASICAMLALAACSSPASDISFNAPAGWKSSPGVLGRFQMWMTGTNEKDRQVLLLVRGDRSMTIQDTTSMTGARGVHDYKRSSIKICGNRPADFFTASGEANNGGKKTPETVEGLMTTVGNSKYLAVYLRPSGMPAGLDAEGALHSICPKK